MLSSPARLPTVAGTPARGFEPQREAARLGQGSWSGAKLAAAGNCLVFLIEVMAADSYLEMSSFHTKRLLHRRRLGAIRHRWVVRGAGT